LATLRREKLEYQPLQERTAATEARLKLFEAKKSDNNRGAAAPHSVGWGAWQPESAGGNKYRVTKDIDKFPGNQEQIGLDEKKFPQNNGG